MEVTTTAIAGLLVIEPKLSGDARGFFYESFNQKRFHESTGLDVKFVQDNHSRSARRVLRGLHYQLQQPQGKLVRVVRGAVFDVALDIRKHSPTFGQWMGIELTEDNRKQLWLPPGLAHGFMVVSDTADVLYKTTSYYKPELERCIAWNDPALAIQWPLNADPILSPKDRMGLMLRDAELA